MVVDVSEWIRLYLPNVCSTCRVRPIPDSRIACSDDERGGW